MHTTFPLCVSLKAKGSIALWPGDPAGDRSPLASAPAQESRCTRASTTRHPAPLQPGRHDARGRAAPGSHAFRAMLLVQAKACSIIVTQALLSKPETRAQSRCEGWLSQQLICV